MRGETESNILFAFLRMIPTGLFFNVDNHSNSFVFHFLAILTKLMILANVDALNTANF